MRATSDQLAAGRTEAVLRHCIATLQLVAAYRLPPALDARLLWLSENKERLTDGERHELSALLDFAEDRTLEKVKARATLQRLGEPLPEVVSEP
ncbi:MAG TPA: hypothetical protein VGM03_12285 [Phycisphaerae bacterium]